MSGLGQTQGSVVGELWSAHIQTHLMFYNAKQHLTASTLVYLCYSHLCLPRATLWLTPYIQVKPTVQVLHHPLTLISVQSIQLLLERPC